MTGFGTEIQHLADGTRVLVVTGELDLETAPAFETEFRAAIDSGATAVIVDLSECEYLDSSGLTVLVKARKHLDGTGPDLALVITHPHVLKVFEITNLDQIFTIHPTREPVSEAARRTDSRAA